MENNIIREANLLFQNQDFQGALELYRHAQLVFPELSESLEVVIAYTENQASVNIVAGIPNSSIAIDRFSGEVFGENVDLDKNDPRLKIEKPDDLEDYYFEQIVESKLFDPEYYLSEYFQELKHSGNLLADYLATGVEKKRNPSKSFNTEFYLKHNPDVAQADINPFLHYVCNGRFEGRDAVPKPYDPPYQVAPVNYVERLPQSDVCEDKAVRVICFYLPQFHAIPENDEWWGKGFTEWTNVKPAKPQFEGHYQPHVPDDFLGYYNLLEKETQRKQIELAKQYGVEGFCYYLYWFSGQRLLEQPLDNMLSDKSLDFPFCVCWANENWSRRWDGLENDLLMVQDYSPQDDIAFIESTSKYLKDERYITIEGKPLLMVYRPNLFPDMKATVNRWREWCRKNGIGEIFLAYPQSFESVAPAEYDFDGAVEFPPNKSNPPNITEFQKPVVDDFQSTIYDWRVFMERSEQYQNAGYTLFRSVTPSWDNTARKKNKGTIFHNSCPTLFEMNTVNAFNEAKQTARSKDEEIVFVNAWNEWAEGAHLEPDQKYGYAWLQAIKRAHARVLENKNKILLVSHDAHPHGAQILSLNLAKQFSQKLNLDVEMIVLGDGPLLAKFAKYANVHQLDLQAMSDSQVMYRLRKIRDKSVGAAIVNTTVSGKLTPFLKRSGFSVVSLIHELPNVLRDMKLEEHASAIAENADQIIFPAHQVREGFEHFIGKTLTNARIRPQGIYLPSVLHSGVDKKKVRDEVREHLGIPQSSKIIMCAGYADFRKGFDIFVKSALSIMKSDDSVYALWIGHWDKPFVQKVLNSINELDLKKRLILPGLIEDPRKYYVAADVYALTSREDPFPSVVLESLDALTPVVGFKGCGGFENLLSRDCGVLVEKENIDEYIDALIKVLSDKVLASELAKEGQRIVQSELSFYHYLFDLLQFGGVFLPKISVVIPNYNYEKYIESRIHSVVNQTFPVYEIIVLDDLSTDNSVDVIQDVISKIDLPSRLIVNSRNSGSVFKQWKFGADVASGDLLWIAEADDLADSTFLEKLVKSFMEKDVVLAFSQSKQIDQDNNLLANDYTEYTRDVGAFWNDDYKVDGNEEIKRALCVKNTIPNVSGVLFDRKVFKSAMIKLEPELSDLRVAGDWLVYIEVLRSGKIAFCKESLNSHRRHTNSVTKQHNHFEEIKVIQDRVSSEWLLSMEAKRKIEDYRAVLKRHFNIT